MGPLDGVGHGGDPSVIVDISDAARPGSRTVTTAADSTAQRAGSLRATAASLMSTITDAPRAAIRRAASACRGSVGSQSTKTSAPDSTGSSRRWTRRESRPAARSNRAGTRHRTRVAWTRVERSPGSQRTAGGWSFTTALSARAPTSQ
ncbi:MAG: hypothetical protein AAGK32_11800, partial [Actinomycetota bacterium]